MITYRSAERRESDSTEYYQQNLTNLLISVEHCDDLPMFRNYFFALIQVYHDALIADPDCKKLDQETRSRVLEDLLLAGKEFTGQYYLERDPGFDYGNVDLDEIQGLVLANKSNIEKYSSQALAKQRHLERIPEQVQRFGYNLAQISDSIDAIVAVASGGIEPACLAAYVLGVDYVVPVRFSYASGGRHDTEVMLHKRDVLGTHKKFLIIEDITDTGKSLDKVTEWILQHQFNVLYASVVNGSSNPFTYSDEIVHYPPIWKYNPTPSIITRLKNAIK